MGLRAATTLPGSESPVRYFDRSKPPVRSTTALSSVPHTILCESGMCKSQIEMSLVYPFQMSLSLDYGFEEFVAGCCRARAFIRSAPPGRAPAPRGVCALDSVPLHPIDFFFHRTSGPEDASIACRRSQCSITESSHRGREPSAKKRAKGVPGTGLAFNDGPEN